MKRFLASAIFLIFLVGDAGVAVFIPGDIFSASAQQQTGAPPKNNPENFHDESAKQLEEDKKSILDRLDEIVSIKEFQTNVFFGGFATIFLALAIIFILSLCSNMFGSGVSGVVNRVKSLLGMNTGRQTGLVSPIATAARDDRYPTRQSPPKNSSPKKKFMFCEVLTSFVNPSVKMHVVQKALTEQKKHSPRPLIGEFLKTQKLVTDDDVSRTLNIQKKYRKRRN